MRIFRKMLPVWFLAGIVLLNWLLSFALCPSWGQTHKMWEGLRKETDIDTVYLGSSFTQNAIDPEIMDEKTGGSSYNMGTAGQPIDQTVLALKEAIRTQPVKRAILAVGAYSFQDRKKDEYRVTFISEMKAGQNPLQRLGTDLQFLSDARYREDAISVNFLFPWIYKHVTPGRILENIKRKIYGMETDPAAERNVRMEMAQDCSGTVKNFKQSPMYRGFTATNRLLNYNTIGNTNTKTKFTKPVSDEIFDDLDDLCRLCAENDVELIVISIPRTPMDLISYGPDYFKLTDRITDFLEERGVNYYDLDLVKPEYFEQNSEYFADCEHLNMKGAVAFCNFFAEFLMSIDAGEDVTEYFYTPEEYLASIDYITNIYFESRNEADGIHITAHAYHGTGVEAEYQITWKNPETEEYEVLRDYSTDPEYVVPPEYVKDGVCYIRVNARKVGSEKEVERYYGKKISYET